MSVLGQQRTCRAEIAMSALPLKADIRRRQPRCPLWANNCREQMQQTACLFDHLVGTGEKRRRDRQTERLGSIEVYN
jgi:hypothetical protein